MIDRPDCERLSSGDTGSSSDRGEELQSAHSQCPTCGTPNAPDRTECEVCRANLVRTSSAQDGRQEEEDTGAITENWLAELRASADGAESAAEEPPAGSGDKLHEDLSVLAEDPTSDTSEVPSESGEPTDEPPLAQEETSPQEAAALHQGSEASASPEPPSSPYWLQKLKLQGSGQGEDSEDLLGVGRLLQGLSELIPASRAVEAGPFGEARPLIVTSETDVSRAELLRSLWAEPITESKPSATASSRNLGALLERLLVAIVLIVPVLGVLLTPAADGGAPPVTQPVAGPGATMLYETVDQLDAADAVFIAFDYGPPEADELNAVARPVLEHLTTRAVTISIASTRPDGLPVAEALMKEIAGPDSDYLLVGYRPGASAAISHLLGAVDETPAMLLIITSWPGSLQGWVEQAQARFGDELPVVAVGSAVLEPIAEPYAAIDAGQLTAAIHGLRGAAAYESLRDVPGDATHRLDALAAGHLAIVALMITGAAVYGLSESRRRQR